MMEKYILLVSFLLNFSASAGEISPPRDLHAYPCDVFLSSACFRLPNDSTVTYGAPSDYGIYEIKSFDIEVMRIYAGSAPDRKFIDNKNVLKLKSPSHTLSAYSTIFNGKKRIDIYIDPKSKKRLAFHATAIVSDGTRFIVATLVSGLRSCTRTSQEVFYCPVESAWGKTLFSWVLSQ